MSSRVTDHAPDIYVASFSDLHRWGGGTAAAHGLAEACRQRGLRTTVLGLSPQGGASGTPRQGDRCLGSPPQKSRSTGTDVAAGASPAVGDQKRRFEPTAGEAQAATRLLRRTVSVVVRSPPALWRVQSWRVAGVLRRRLRRLPPPRVALVGSSPFWVVAAKRAWPSVPVIYRFPCLLTRCLPFTWERRIPRSIWERVNFAGVSHTESLAIRLADLTLAATPHGVEEVSEFCPSARGRVVQCHFGCQPVSFDDSLRVRQRDILGLDEDAFLVAAIGVCDRNKAFDLAVRELPRSDPRTVLAVVGDGPERTAWRRLAEGLGVAARVRFVGPQHDMAPWHAAADCVVSTSFYDAYPNVIREAMYCGRPVIVPRHDPPHVYCGISDFVEAEVGGLVYDRRRPGGLADCINRLVDDRALSGEMGRRAAAVAKRRFHWEGLLDHVLARSGESSSTPSTRPRSPTWGHAGSA